MGKKGVIGLLVLAVAVLGSPLSSQTTDLYRFETGQWTKDGFFLSGFMKESLRLSAKGSARLVPESILPKEQRVKRPANAPPPPKHFGGKVMVANDRMFFTALERAETPVAVLWERGPEGGWNATVRLAHRKRSPYFPPVIGPLANGKYLVLNPNPPEDKPDGTEALSPFAVYRSNEKGELGLSSYIDPGIEKCQGNIHLRRDFTYLSSATIVDDCFIICGWKYGLFWVFSLEDGRIKRFFRLYNVIKDEDIAKNRSHQVILNYQPLKDGTLLVAARQEDGVKELAAALAEADAQGESLMQGFTNPQQVTEALRFLNRERDLIFRQFPFVAWYEIDPETGSKRKLELPPAGGKEMLP
jgi:hypothetical protein